MASVRSSNTFYCMLQTRVNWIINAYMAACGLRGFESDLVKESPSGVMGVQAKLTTVKVPLS